MPPKQKITREQLLDHAFRIAQEQGIAAVTSRSVAQAAGCSIQPVFSHFPTMENLRRETYLYACDLVNAELMNQQFSGDFATQPMGIILRLARKQPNLFELIYLSGNLYGGGLWETMEPWQCNQKVIAFFAEKYGLAGDCCQDIFERSFFLFFGIATMVAKGRLAISDEEAAAMIQRTVADLITARQKEAEK